jgi:hypothetical protein
MEKLLKKRRNWILIHCLSLLAQLTPADFALAGRLVRMLLAPTMLGHSNRPLAHTRIKPSRQSKPAPPALRRMNYSKERPGNIYSVHNNLPYAEPLAGGPSFPPSWKAAGVTGSKQAPAGWVQGIAKDVQGRVIAAAAKIGRES